MIIRPRKMRDTINVQPTSASVVAGTAFAVGLVIGGCVFLVPFAMSGKSTKQAEVKTATTSGVAASGSISGANAPSSKSPAPVAPAANRTTAVASTDQPKPASRANDDTSRTQDEAAVPTAGCDRQAWPYVTQECRDRMARAAGGNRQVRVVTTDSNAPTSIVTPPPVIAPPSAKREVPPPPATVAARTALAPTTSTPAAPQSAQANPAQSNSPSQTATAAVAAPQPPSPPASPAVAGARASTPADQSAVAEVQPATAEAPTKGAAHEANSKDRKSRNPRDQRRGERDEKSGRMMVRTIEFSDGRRVTITHPIGKGGAAAAKEALDRASERAMARERGEGTREAEAEPRGFSQDHPVRRIEARSDDVDMDRSSRQRAWYEPDPEPAMGQADDDEVPAPRPWRASRHRPR